MDEYLVGLPAFFYVSDYSSVSYRPGQIDIGFDSVFHKTLFFRLNVRASLLRWVDERSFKFYSITFGQEKEDGGEGALYFLFHSISRDY